MKKLSLIFLATVSLMSVTGCQSVGQNWNDSSNNYVYQTNQKFLSKPKNVQKCWNDLAKFDSMVSKRPKLATFNASLFEKKISASGRSVRMTTNNPCVMLPNYVPAAQKSIARARYIGAQSVTQY